MPQDEELSWRDQLFRLRNKVVEAEKQRGEEKKRKLEHSREVIAERLKSDTPEALTRTFNELKKRHGGARREFFPLEPLEQGVKELGEFGGKLRFYKESQKEYPKLLTSRHKQTIDKLLKSVGELQRSLEKQIVQWRRVKEILEATRFRPREPEDDPGLLDVAKRFHTRAYEIELRLPSDFFAGESEDFYVAELDGKPYGYVKYLRSDGMFSFALVGVRDANFGKLVQGFLYCFCKSGIMAGSPDAVKVRLSHPDEVKFYTNLGFQRTETRGVSSWTYSRKLD